MDKVDIDGVCARVCVCVCMRSVFPEYSLPLVFRARLFIGVHHCSPLFIWHIIHNSLSCVASISFIFSLLIWWSYTMLLRVRGEKLHGTNSTVYFLLFFLSPSSLLLPLSLLPSGQHTMNICWKYYRLGPAEATILNTLLTTVAKCEWEH